MNNIFVPGVDVSVVAVIKLKEVSQNEDHIRVRADLLDECCYKRVACMILSCKVRIGKEDAFHHDSAR